MQRNGNPKLVRLLETHGRGLIAELGECRPQAVSNWRRRGGIPMRAAVRILRNARQRGISISADDLMSA